MIDNLNEAIAHAKEVAKEKRKDADYVDAPYGMDTSARTDCLECANEHEQLAAWLTELQERREADRWNVINTEADLPKESDWYFVTREDRKGRRFTEMAFFYESEKEFNRHFVIAWRPLPKAPESEAEE